MSQKKWGAFVFASVVVAVSAGLAPRASAQASRLLVSTESDAISAGGKAVPFLEEEILFMGPSGPSTWLGFQNWRVLVGDADGDGHFDDQPSEVDALAVVPGAPARPSVYDLLVSFSTDRSFASGERARDGDVVRLLPGGSVEVTYSEDSFAAVTSTGAIDVDAFAIGPDGTVYFSFAEDEETSAGYLTVENGGSPTLDESCVFTLAPGAFEAHLYLAPDAILGIVNRALGSALTTVGDVQGLELDPENPGALLFAVSSKSRGPEGTVFSTIDGGRVASLGGVTLAGETMGFGEAESLDSLAVVADQKAPFFMRADVTEASVSTVPFVEVSLSHGTPGGSAVVMVAPAVLPAATPLPMPKLGGAGRIYLDVTSSLFKTSLRNRKYRATLDSNGCGAVRFATAGTPVGIVRLVQAVDLSSLEASEAVAIETIP